MSWGVCKQREGEVLTEFYGCSGNILSGCKYGWKKMLPGLCMLSINMYRTVCDLFETHGIVIILYCDSRKLLCTLVNSLPEVITS